MDEGAGARRTEGEAMTTRDIDVGQTGRKFYVEFDEDELAARILEALVGSPRPPGINDRDLIRRTLAREPKLARAALASAKVALNYMAERFERASEVQ
jgi:hypothetical protein